jgi:hypothetical protein
MTESTAVMTVAQWLAGEFENPTQAREQPIWFVHLRLWYRPVPHRLAGRIALFAEQAPILTPEQAYRQRILTLWASEAGIKGQYWALRHPDRWRTAGANGADLQSLRDDDLEELPGCCLTIQYQGDRARGELEPGARCCFDYAGQTRQVIVGFEVTPQRLLSFDRGVDPDTGRGLWGALMGPYEFDKCRDFSSELIPGAAG